jgi:glycogen debranching enzyme
VTHDNALIAYGLALYCLKDAVLKVATGLFDASRFVGLQRLPELFCGFPRHFGEGPTLYPVACSPQAWSAAAPVLLLQACLGLRIDAPGSRIVFSCPALPESLQVVRLENLRVGQVTVSLLLERRSQGVGIEVLHNENSLQIVLEP